MNDTPPSPEPSTYSYILMIVFAIVGLTCVTGVLVLVYSPSIGDQEWARNVITTVFTVGTISVAIILVLGVLLLQDANAAERFAKGKEILTILVGILGTIVGFYFGATAGRTGEQKPGTQQTAPEDPAAVQEPNNGNAGS